MHRNECITVLNDVLKIDEDLIENHLGLKWEAPLMPDDQVQQLLQKPVSLLNDDLSSNGM